MNRIIIAISPVRFFLPSGGEAMAAVMMVLAVEAAALILGTFYGMKRLIFICGALLLMTSLHPIALLRIW
jgi:hypothetical protein